MVLARQCHWWKRPPGSREEGVPILGYGNSGDSRVVRFIDLRPAYDLARQEGYSLCGHANEIQDVSDALEIGLDRIDHGWTAFEETDVFDQVVAAHVPLTLCPSASRLVFGEKFVTAFEAFRAAGTPIAIGTDDPYLFFTDLAQEYAGMAYTCGWEPRTIGDLATNSLQVAWLDGPSAAERRAGWATTTDALLDDVCAPTPMIDQRCSSMNSQLPSRERSRF